MKTNERALAAYMDKVSQITEQLTTLQNYVDDHMNADPDNVNWGDVGSADKVLSDLEDIMASLGLKTSQFAEWRGISPDNAARRSQARRYKLRRNEQ